MSPRKSASRDRMILSAAALLREYRASATSVDLLVESGFRAGCPIVAVAVETNDDAPQLARSAAAVFARWQEALAALFLRHGLTEERSRRLGAFVIAAAEGAVIMCRAEQSTAPIEAAAAEIHDLLLTALRERSGA